MDRERFRIDYAFDNVSKRSLWNHITTPNGLSSWFADKVYIEGNMYYFTWHKMQERAEVLSLIPNVNIRYRWEDDEDSDVYFEFMIHTTELTRGIALEITDFATPDEKADAIDLWDSQVAVLKHTLGI